MEKIMLTAILNREKIFASEEFERGKKYICPNSNYFNLELILREGIIKILHFTYKKKSEFCEIEPETKEHLIMRQLLVHRFNIKADFVEY